jgi:hypothetical protein
VTTERGSQPAKATATARRSVPEWRPGSSPPTLAPFQPSLSAKRDGQRGTRRQSARVRHVSRTPTTRSWLLHPIEPQPAATLKEMAPCELVSETESTQGGEVVASLYQSRRSTRSNMTRARGLEGTHRDGPLPPLRVVTASRPATRRLGHQSAWRTRDRTRAMTATS